MLFSEERENFFYKNSRQGREWKLIRGNGFCCFQVCKLWAVKVKDKHFMFSLITKKKHSNFNNWERTATLCVYISFLLLGSALFYGQKQNTVSLNEK